jgi:hypothetical protein
MKQVEITSSEGVGALCTMRQIKCNVTQEQFDDLLSWVTREDSHENKKASLELVEPKK